MSREDDKVVDLASARLTNVPSETNNASLIKKTASTIGLNYANLGPDTLSQLARGLVRHQFGSFVKDARASQDLTQTDLASLVGVTQARISQWENMETSAETIDLENIYKIAIVCGAQVDLKWQTFNAGDNKSSKVTPSSRSGKLGRAKNAKK